MAGNMDSRLIVRRSDRAERWKDFVDARGLAVCRCKVRLPKYFAGYTCRSLRR